LEFEEEVGRKSSMNDQDLKLRSHHVAGPREDRTNTTLTGVGPDPNSKAVDPLVELRKRCFADTLLSHENTLMCADGLEILLMTLVRLLDTETPWQH
jgi:hypothetical protein